MMEDVVTVVMAGGMGERLKPLTSTRAKPAVPFGGVFRIIDFALSNCVNSGLRQIYVLTQYKSHSLSAHLKMGWSFLPRRLDNFIEEIPAQMQLGDQWYSGTADAIRQNMPLLVERRARRVLILPGDHVYKMDYRPMLRLHDARKASLTLATVRVDPQEARGRCGVVQVDADGFVQAFEEKPAEPKMFLGTGQCLASMGIYIFDWDCLERNIANDLTDFGRDVIPAMLKAGERVCAFDFTRDNAIEEYEYTIRDGQREKTRVARASDCDYWRDVGTIHSYWQANLDLVAPKPRFNLYSELWPLFICPQHFPPAKFVHEEAGRVGTALNSIVADGVIISGSTVRRSILGPGTFIHSHSIIEDSVLMGGKMTFGLRNETQIGRDCRIRNAIIDKNVTIMEQTQLGYDRKADEARGLTTTDIPGSHDYIVTVAKDVTA